MSREREQAEDFPPKVPCPGQCAYGACGEPGGPSRDSYGCGGCCRCLGGCHLEWALEQAYIPETKEQAEWRRRWEAIGLMPKEERFTL